MTELTSWLAHNNPGRRALLMNVVHMHLRILRCLQGVVKLVPRQNGFLCFPGHGVAAAEKDLRSFSLDCFVAKKLVRILLDAGQT